MKPLTDRDIVEFEHALAEWYETADEYPPEWWADFDRFLRENRLNFEERLDPLSFGHEHDLGPDKPRSHSGATRAAGAEGP